MSVIGSASGDTDVTCGAHRTCYFAKQHKLRPCASIIVDVSFASRPLYFVVIQFIVLNLVVVSLCVDS